MTNLPMAIIGGTGVYQQSYIGEYNPLKVNTTFGPVLLYKGEYCGKDIYFLPRHGELHTLAPHRINYRANIAALKKLSVEQVIATAAVGSLQRDIPPGSRVVIDQFIDFTRSRTSTFFDEDDGLVVHTDFTEPYCPNLRSIILDAGSSTNQQLINGGCYICTDGPRFETPAEIKMFAKWGGDLVGMTNVPEVILARESGLCYAVIAVVTNYAAGISKDPLTHSEVFSMIKELKPDLDLLLAACIEKAGVKLSCSCRVNETFWDKGKCKQ